MKMKKFPEIKKVITQGEKAAKAATKTAEKVAKAAAQEDDWDSSDDEESGPESQSSGVETDFDEGMGTPNATPGATDLHSAVEVKSDDKETGIGSFNGHQWELRCNLEFQVVWTDGDMTWEPLANVNDCAAMEEYPAHRNINDPLLLSKRKFLINPALKAMNVQF
ncbi:hypothetical protein B0H17DRAFT_1205332 [Mycena rosella]|uniref:Chromo domain-containing protein n=1 Tax=Mycena rosella TaxID=1033263 RepID=A0AAD7GA45_MYCRO|nr:hypothetical protein B0H17DRAFT_1205332 [Mycena rosella]